MFCSIYAGASVSRKASGASGQNLYGLELGAFPNDLLGVSVGGLVDLQQPGSLRQRPQSGDGVGALEVPLLQPFLQVADVAPK